MIVRRRVVRESFSRHRVGPLGLAVHTKGANAQACASMFAATMTPFRRFQMRTLSAGRRFPVAVPDWTESYVDNEAARVTIGYLAAVLRSRPDLQERLGQRDRAWQLADTLADGLLTRSGLKWNWSAHEMQVVRALRAGGFHHRYSRPLQASETQPTDVTITSTVERLIAEHGPRSRFAQPSFVEAVARVSYLDVAPWPFAPLVR